MHTYIPDLSEFAMARTDTRALVLSGGGFAGGAWMFGLIAGLRHHGVNLGDADLIVGTSAGARVGAALATGALDKMVETYRRGEAPTVTTTVRMEQFMAAVGPIMAGTADPQQAARRVANLAPLGSRLVDDDERRRVVAAHLPAPAWPDQPLAITAVDAESGRRVVFDAGSGVALADALAASSSLPGIYPLTTINGRRYADGGVHSLYNADLAAGHETVTVISPMPLTDQFRRQLDTELATLHPAQVHLVTADTTSLAAIGPNSLSADAGPPALDAGLAQAEREAETMGS